MADVVTVIALGHFVGRLFRSQVRSLRGKTKVRTSHLRVGQFHVLVDRWPVLVDVDVQNALGQESRRLVRIRAAARQNLDRARRYVCHMPSCQACHDVIMAWMIVPVQRSGTTISGVHVAHSSMKTFQA